MVGFKGVPRGYTELKQEYEGEPVRFHGRYHGLDAYSDYKLELYEDEAATILVEGLKEFSTYRRGRGGIKPECTDSIDLIGAESIVGSYAVVKDSNGDIALSCQLELCEECAEPISDSEESEPEDPEDD